MVKKQVHPAKVFNHKGPSKKTVSEKIIFYNSLWLFNCLHLLNFCFSVSKKTHTLKLNKQGQSQIKILVQALCKFITDARKIFRILFTFTRDQAVLTLFSATNKLFRLIYEMFPNKVQKNEFAEVFPDLRARFEPHLVRSAVEIQFNFNSILYLALGSWPVRPWLSLSAGYVFRGRLCFSMLFNS